jgi:hypothetical protein
MSTISSLFCERLDYTFERDECAYVRMNSKGSLEYVIFIHNIHGGQGSSDVKSCHLMATKYSFHRLAHPFQEQQSSGENEVATSNKELLLHFGDFDKMGKQGDAGVMRLDDIAYSENLASGFWISSDSVDHIVRPASDGNKF